MQRNQLIAVAVVIIIVASAGAYFLLSPHRPSIDSIVYETIGGPQYLDPAVDYETAGSEICYNVYETLYTYAWGSADTTPSVPLLATGLSISSDGLNYTFTLRQGVKFQDGTPFNASCVKYNFERVLAMFDSFGPAWMLAEPILGGQAVEDAVYEYGEGSAQHIGNYTAWKAANDAGTGAITVLGDYSILIRLAKPYAPFLAAITYEVGAIVSPTYVEKNGGVTIGEHNTFMDTHMCGTGPYSLDTFVADQRTDLKINPDYWRADNAQAYNPNSGSIKTVSYVVNTEVNSRILNLQAGVDDVADWPTDHAFEVWNNVTGSNGDGTLKSSNPNLKLWCALPTYDVMFLGLNMNPTYNKSTGTNPGICKSPFTDINARTAFAYAFDYQSFITNVVNGFGDQLKGPIPKGMFGYKSDLPMFSYDLVKAQTAWNTAMANGLNDVWANNSYELTIYYNEGNTVREAACLLLKDGITALLAMDGTTQPGQALTINVQPLTWPNYLYQVQHRQLPIFFLGWAPDFADPDDYVGPFVKSTGTYPMRIGLGQSEGWNATYYDGLISDAAASQDTTTRQNLYYEIQTAIVNQVAYIWCYQATNFHVEYHTMQGYWFNPMLSGPYWYNYWKTG